MAAAIDYLNDRNGLYKELAERSLKSFVRQAWGIVEPSYVFVPNWHLDALCDHLEAFRRGVIRKLLVNMPPRFLKSIICAIMFPAWVWTTEPGKKFVYSSYAQNLSVRDSMAMRRLIKSPWYQNNWQVDFERDQDNKTKYQNQFTGYRVATSVGGQNTGEGGDWVFTDDPHNVMEAESDVKLASTIKWWDEVMSSRLNDRRYGGRCVVMQVTGQKDLTNHLIEKGGWTRLFFPMEYDPEDKCQIDITGFEDPRTAKGELLCPQRIDEAENEELKLDLGKHAYDNQYNQKRTPRRGTLIDVDKIELRISPSAPIKKSIRAWDKAYTENAGARTAGVKMALLTNGKICILDSSKGQWGTAKRNRRMKDTAMLDGKKVHIWIEQEGAAGKESAENSVKELVGFRAHAEVPKGDKEMRNEPFQIQVDANNVECIIGDFTEEYIHELRKFPNGRFKDQVDASSLALKKLTDDSNRVTAG